MSDYGEIDRLDRKIIRELSRDGRMSITDLSARVGLSKSPRRARVARLRDRGIITGFAPYSIRSSWAGDHIVFAEVKLTSTTEAALSAFNAAVRDVAEIEECHMIAGAFDYLLKVRTSDIKAYRQVLGETISALPHVGATSTHVSMQAVKAGVHELGWTICPDDATTRNEQNYIARTRCRRSELETQAVGRDRNDCQAGSRSGPFDCNRPHGPGAARRSSPYRALEVVFSCRATAGASGTPGAITRCSGAGAASHIPAAPAAGVHVGFAAKSLALHEMADPADGEGSCDIGEIGQLS